MGNTQTDIYIVNTYMYDYGTVYSYEGIPSHIIYWQSFIKGLEFWDNYDKTE